MLATRVLRALPKPNPTGFDVNAFKRAATSQRYDPWARAEAWRYEGQFTRFNRFRNALPGFGTAAVAFAGYCTYEHFFMTDPHHHGDAHGEAHAHAHGNGEKPAAGEHH